MRKVVMILVAVMLIGCFAASLASADWYGDGHRGGHWGPPPVIYCPAPPPVVYYPTPPPVVLVPPAPVYQPPYQPAPPVVIYTPFGPVLIR